MTEHSANPQPPRGFVMHVEDNVATLLDAASAGPVALLGQRQGSVQVRGPVEAGHKVAIEAVAVGGAVVKNGVVIGDASSDLAIGDWIHLHNLRSRYDERSHAFDLHSGASEDVKYE